MPQPSQARQRIRVPLLLLLERFRDRTGAAVDTGLMHLLRDFGVTCYEMGRADLHEQTTLPAPKKDDHDAVEGSYSVGGRTDRTK